MLVNKQYDWDYYIPYLPYFIISYSRHCSHHRHYHHHYHRHAYYHHQHHYIIDAPYYLLLLLFNYVNAIGESC